MGIEMMKTLTRNWLMPLTATLLLVVAAPTDAFAKSAEEAARQAARQHNAAKVLSVKTEQQGNRKVHVVKLLTKDGVVKTVRVPDDGR
jgi:ketopantoate hydroxymethyltransferase